MNNSKKMALTTKHINNYLNNKDYTNLLDS